MDDANDPTPRLPAEPLRRVDWMALAPWLLVFRTAGALVGWPLLIAAVGMLALEWPGATSRVSPEPLEASRALVASWPESFLGWRHGARTLSELGRIGWAAARFVGWSCLGLLIAEHAARALTGSPPVGLLASLWGGVRRLPRLLGAWLLYGVPAFLLAGLLLVYGLVLRQAGDDSLLGVLWGPAALLLGLPLAVIGAVAVLASPLLIAAIVVDEADPFDGVSRTVAYTFQRPAVLIACLAAAWLGAVVGGAVVQWLVATTHQLTAALAAPGGGVWGGAWMEGSMRAFLLVAGAFYPAYLYTAGVAVYLVMRRAVDGQPVDEIAATADQPSAA